MRESSRSEIARNPYEAAVQLQIRKLQLRVNDDLLFVLLSIQFEEIVFVQSWNFKYFPSVHLLHISVERQSSRSLTIFDSNFVRRPTTNLFYHFICDAKCFVPFCVASLPRVDANPQADNFNMMQRKIWFILIGVGAAANEIRFVHTERERHGEEDGMERDQSEWEREIKLLSLSIAFSFDAQSLLC